MRIVLDTEFSERDRVITPISFALARSDGSNYYAVSSEFDPADTTPWVQEHVIPHLGDHVRKPLAQIADDIVAFAGEAPEFWADHGAHDWVLLCQLYGDMAALPDGWPTFCRDISQLAEDLGSPALPLRAGLEHHALSAAVRGRAYLLLLAQRRHAASFYDPQWRAWLASDLAAAILSRLALAERFGHAANVVELPDSTASFSHVQPLSLFATGRPLAWVERHSVPSSLLDGQFEVVPVPVDFVAGLDLPDMCAWGLAGLHEQVVVAAARALVDALWTKVAALVDHAGTAPTADIAAARIALTTAASAPGPMTDFDLPGPMTDFEMPNGVRVVARKRDLTLAVGHLRVKEGLGDDGNAWSFAGRLPLAAALFTDGARRLLAEAPGPLRV